MNKKFSTLVAALLVSGGSFAMVSQYIGSALSESPLAVAAAANLRATTGSVVAQAGTEVTPTEWHLSATANFKLNVSGETQYLGADASGNIVLTDANDAKTFNYTDNHLVDGADVLVIEKTTGKLKVVAGATMPNGNYSYATLFNGTAHVDGAVSAAAGTNYKIAAEEIAPAAITTAESAVKITAGSVVLTQGAGNSASIAGAQGLANLPTKVTKAKLVSVGGANKYLQVTTAAGTSLYMHVDNSGAITFTESADYEDDGVYSKVSIDAENKSIVLGTGKSLIFDTNFKADNYNDAKAVYALKTADKTTIYATVGDAEGALNENVEFYLLNITETGATAWVADGGKGNIVDLKYTAGTTPAAEAQGTLTSPTASPFKLTEVQGGFTLSVGYEFLPKTVGAMLESSDANVGVFSLDPVDGALKVDGEYLLNSSGTLDNTTGNKLYLYVATANLTGAKKVVEYTDGSEYFLAESPAGVVEALDVTKTKVVVATVDATEPEGTAKDLTDGAKYTIKGDKFLNLVGGELTVGTTGQYWIVTKYETTGQQTYYSFTNAENGKALAFNKNRQYAADGDYNRFFVTSKGEITFNVDGKTYEVNINTANVTIDKYAADAEPQNKFTEAKAEPIAVGGAVDQLNKILGTGNGFSVMFKNMAITEDKVKDITLESNPFSDATLIQAVEGPDATAISDLRGISARQDLSNAMFLKVSGSYPLTPEQLDAKGADNDKKKAAAQVDAFRSSKFIAVDTVAYTKGEDFYKYVTVSGSSMLSYKGYVFDENADENDFKRSGALEGVTRRIENAQFTLQQVPDGTVTDAIQLVVAEAYMPKDKNGEKYAVKGHNVEKNGLSLAVKSFNGKNYLGAGAAPVEAYKYVYVGSNNDVDYKTINGIVTLISRNYKTDGQVYATTADHEIDLVLPKYVSTDKPEGQYLVTGGYAEGGIFHPFVFTNRESGITKKIDGLKKTDKANVYAAGQDTIEIKAASTANEFVGYANYDADVLKNTQYVLKVVSNAAGIKDIYIAEDHNKDHSLGLNADTLEAANFKLIKFEAGADMPKFKDYGDTVFVSQKNYSYVAVDKKTKEEYYADDAEDRVVAFTYAIYNADNNEFLDVNGGQGTTVAEYFYCNPNLKYNGSNEDKAQRFIIKEKANGAVQLIPVAVHNADFLPVTGTNDPRKVVFYNYNGTTNDGIADAKLYAGISDNKLYAQGPIYLLTDNDLFTIQQIGAPLYRTLDVTGNVRIYKEGMPNIALFAESADKALVSGQNLLGMEHKADADLNKTMFSFLLDTAYVNRANNYTPQYLLAIDATVTPGGKWCETHQSATCEHAVETAGYVKGSYLVSLADSAAAVAASQAHKNPYMYDGYNRLGFVKATHIGDKLAIERAKAVKADTLDLTGMTKASFALRIVDQATQSFALQTNGGYVKWLNGVPVLVNDFAQAEVLNIESTENAATANEAIEAAGVQVVAGKGVVTVQGAAGKVITVANILGQTIANQVAASDNVTIAAPAGVVVVAVDGDATKVVVK